MEKDSVINVSQILTINKEILIEPVGFLSSRYLKKVDKGIKTVLSLA